MLPMRRLRVVGSCLVAALLMLQCVSMSPRESTTDVKWDSSEPINELALTLLGGDRIEFSLSHGRLWCSRRRGATIAWSKRIQEIATIDGEEVAPGAFFYAADEEGRDDEGEAIAEIGVAKERSGHIIVAWGATTNSSAVVAAIDKESGHVAWKTRIGHNRYRTASRKEFTLQMASNGKLVMIQVMEHRRPLYVFNVTEDGNTVQAPMSTGQRVQ